MIAYKSWEYDTAEMLCPIPARCPSPREQPETAAPQPHNTDLLANFATSEDPVEGVCCRVVASYGFTPRDLARLVRLTGSFGRALKLLDWALKAHWFLKMSFVPDARAKCDGMVDDATLQKVHKPATTKLVWLIEHVANEPRFSAGVIRNHFCRELAGRANFPATTDRRDLDALLGAAWLIVATLARAGRFWHRLDSMKSEVITP